MDGIRVRDNEAVFANRHGSVKLRRGWLWTDVSTASPEGKVFRRFPFWDNRSAWRYFHEFRKELLR